MFSVVIFMDGKVEHFGPAPRAQALTVFMRAYYRLKREHHGVVSLRYNDKPIVIFSGKAQKIKRLDDNSHHCQGSFMKKNGQN